MSWAGSILNVVSAVSGVAGGVADGQASEAERAYSAKVARENAKTVGEQSTMRQEAMRRESDQLLGAQRAAIAESGTGTGGSNALVAAQDAALAELDALTERYEGRLKMAEYDNQAALLSAERVSGMQQLFGKRGLGRFSTINREWETLRSGNPLDGLGWTSAGTGKGRGW
ncbi:hypothetical protein [Caulobacter sp. NIBR1757]|uniref:hypothetical protein n=1 Tax=Caulobacter sp. NIBR1757 TaxID=3016000 RepID=UPI0022F005EB|nr:hypothetical protein [Caulobacter sp. NIBR1757]WGM40807.1 hypothetical protein AMEJIAPC_03754 [Caulobacter sp. NIBR1757]